MSEEPVLYEGPCHGGPMDGQIGQSRFPKGFLLVDREVNQCWIYDYNVDTGCFDERNEGRGMPVLTENRYRAAEESNYDVRSVA
jgi:hypothetical protein